MLRAIYGVCLTVLLVGLCAAVWMGLTARHTDFSGLFRLSMLISVTATLLLIHLRRRRSA